MHREFPAALTLLTGVGLVVYAAIPVPSGASSAGVSLAKPARQVQESPTSPEMQILAELVQQGVEREDFPVKKRIDFLPAPDGNTFAIVVFEVGTDSLVFALPEPDTAGVTEAQRPGAAGTLEPVAEVASLKAFGSFMPSTFNPGQARYDFLAPFDVSRDEGEGAYTETHSFGVTLAPGSYTLAWGILDAANNTANAQSELVEVPNFHGGELVLSSVLVATSTLPQTDPYETGRVYSGVRMASLLFQDDIDRQFSRDENIELIYVVMGAQADPVTRRPKFEVSYRVLLAEDEQSIARFPSQTLESPSVGQPIPLAQISQLNPGESYELEISIKDLLSEAELTHRVRFSTLPEAETVPADG